MARQIIDIGSISNDGTGDSIRDSFRKVNENFRELYGSLGLGERLTFIGLSDTPNTYDGNIDDTNPPTGSSFATSVVTINNTGDGVTFKPLKAGNGIRLNFGAKKDEFSDDSPEGSAIEIVNEFTSITDDTNPILGGNLRTQAGGNQYRILDLPEFDRNWSVGLPGTPGGPIDPREAVSKSYVDSFLSRAGVDAIDPGSVPPRPNSAFGRMTGPLILSRNPEADDDILYDGLIAATKKYVDNVSFGSATNIYVSTAGEDNRPGVSRFLQGSSFAYAFRSIEEALKKAEEIMLNATAEIGPYKKTLTYNNRVGADPTKPKGGVFLASINVSPESGSGFSAAAIMSASVITLRNGGNLYYPGDILEILDGSSDDPSTGTNEDEDYRATLPIGTPEISRRVRSPIRIQVIGTKSTPGEIDTFRVISTGNYSAIPGTTNLETIIFSGAGPEGANSIGVNATFDVTYLVNNVKIIESGSGYSLVSVRIEGGGGTGAFGTADVIDGEVVSISITDQGSGFTSIPVVNADLPRISLYTAGQRTDFTGDILSTSPVAARGRDIREGLFLRGEKSGAIAQILTHNGSLGKYDGTPADVQSSPDLTSSFEQQDLYELFDIDLQKGKFKTPAIGTGSIVGNVLNISSVESNSGFFEVGDLIAGPNIAYNTKITARGTGTGGTGTYIVNIEQTALLDTVIGGEPISYGDITVIQQVSVLIESGTYEENYPLKIPRNVAIIGDEFRRVIIRPRPGISSSPWAFTKFRRDQTVGSTIQSLGVEDSLVIADRVYGYHYLTDTSLPVYPRINNRGGYRSASALIFLNRDFIAEEVVGWIDYQIENNGAPFDETFVYNRALCRRDVVLLLDAMSFDLRWGEYNRTVSSALKYRQNSSGIVAITTQLDQTIAAIERINVIAQQVLANQTIPSNDRYQQVFPQIIDTAFVSEELSYDVFEDLIEAVVDILNEVDLNLPKDNENLDVFLCNDANIVRAVTCQGHGGFMMVLDPEGQILTKSPYAQECASFSRSIDRQIFAGGQFVDGFSGNLQFRHVESTYNLREAIIVSPGIGYAENDELTVSGGVFLRSAIIKVLSVTGLGEISSFNILDTGSYTTLPSSPNTVTGGSPGSSGAEFALSFIATRLSVSNLDRFPQLPSSFLVNDEVYRINYVRDYNFAPEGPLDPERGSRPTGTTATLVLDEVTPFPFEPGDRSATFSYAITVPEFTGSITGNTLTVTAISTGTIIANSEIDGTGIADGTKIVAQLTPLLMGETTGGVGRYTVSGASQTVLSTTIRQRVTAVISDTFHRLQPGATLIFTGDTLPDGIEENTQYYIVKEGFTDNDFRITATYGSVETIRISSLGVNVRYQRIYEILTPGNRSMLGNDFTQINDLGYGIVAANGGLIEAVSVFTYYCWISYYSINGGQIRSVSGSTAHGKYALVAQGADPLEVPTPTGLYEEVSQPAICYAPGAPYLNVEGGFNIWVGGTNYFPVQDGELEVDHGDEIVRYVVSAAEEALVGDVPLVDGLIGKIYRLTIATEDGLQQVIPDGTPLTLRASIRLVLTGDLINVAVRPSTGLIMNDLPETVYRVLQFDPYVDVNGPYEFTVDLGTSILTSTTTPLRIRPGDKISFSSTGPLPEPLDLARSFYYVVADDYDRNAGEFRISGSRNGTAIEFTTDESGETLTYAPFGVVTAKLRENYNFIEMTVFEPGVFAGDNMTGDGTCTFSLDTNPLTLNQIIVSAPGHTLANNDVIKFEVSDRPSVTLPVGLSLTRKYHVVSSDTMAGTFRVSISPGGTPVVGVNIGEGSGAEFTIAKDGSGGYSITAITNGGSAYVTGHKILIAGTDLGGASPANDATITVTGVSGGAITTATITGTSTGGAATYTGRTGTNIRTIYYGLIQGARGTDVLPIIFVSSDDTRRIIGSKFVFLGEEYTVTDYGVGTLPLPPNVSGGQVYGFITLDRTFPLGLKSPIEYTFQTTLLGASPASRLASDGTLTIRISLTRVTGHDLLEIGTGSYKQTNYPNEIYGAPENGIQPQNETQERNVGRVFYVTTDQFGNFSVGPFFRVDQGTGTVSFSANIAISNLNGLGFKRGVSISEFSTDTSMGGESSETGFIDIVPVQYAIRTYIERRLGITHRGEVYEEEDRIPPNAGFIDVNGLLPMRADLNIGDNKVINVADPGGDLTAALNLRSLKLSNIQDLTFGPGVLPAASQFIAFTGTATNARSVTLSGDITAGTIAVNSNIPITIANNAITNAKVSSSAAIAQSKLSMNAADTFTESTGWAGSKSQADLGLSKFSSDNFETSGGYVRIKTNGIALSDLPNIPSGVALGNNSGSSGSVSTISFSDIVGSGGAISRSQYSSVGILARTNPLSNTLNSDYNILQYSSSYSGSIDNDKLVIRDNNGDFAGNTITFSNGLRTATHIVVQRSTGGTGGQMSYFGYTGDGSGSVIIGGGSNAADRLTKYINTNHQFRNLADNDFAPVRASSIQVLTLTTGASGTAGTITGNWSLSSGSRMQATYSADLAEYYEGDREYDVGTVLIFGGEKEVTISNELSDTRVAGVVSDNAAFVMYDACPGKKNLVALQGRVPCKVVGKVRKGDLMVTARIAGVAVSAGRNAQAGTIIGKALADYDSDHIGLIEIAVGRN